MELNFPFLATVTSSRPSWHVVAATLLTKTNSYFCTQEGLQGSEKEKIYFILVNASSEIENMDISDANC